MLAAVMSTAPTFSALVGTLNQAQALFAELQQRASVQGVVLRPPPPQPTTCCGRGCNGCVWESYYDAVVFWRDDAVAALHDNPAPQGAPQ
jgi:hypothetical protein